MIENIFPFLGVIIFIVGLWYGRASEKQVWNNGIAPSGEPWQHFDTDSQGGRGYTDGYGNYIWISYKADK